MVAQLGLHESFAGYVIEDVLGRGGMGTVYLARHPRLPRQVALKLLNRELSTDEEVRRRFEQEANVIARLDHPSIVGIHDRGTEAEHLWIAMQYVRGIDGARLDARTVTAERAVRIVCETAAALDYAHSEGVLHRDIKPANILLSAPQTGRRERAILTDFGIARLLDSNTHLTATGTFTATLAYASPEQLSADDVDHRTDQYALACTFFALLAGRAPFAATNPGQVVAGHLSKPVPRLSHLRPDLPTALDDVIARAMAKQRDHRYPDCTEFTAAAREAVNTRHSTPIALAGRPEPATRPVPAATRQGNARSGWSDQAAPTADPFAANAHASAAMERPSPAAHPSPIDQRRSQTPPAASAHAQFAPHGPLNARAPSSGERGNAVAPPSSPGNARPSPAIVRPSPGTEHPSSTDMRPPSSAVNRSSAESRSAPGGFGSPNSARPSPTAGEQASARKPPTTRALPATPAGGARADRSTPAVASAPPPSSVVARMTAVLAMLCGLFAVTGAVRLGTALLRHLREFGGLRAGLPVELVAEAVAAGAVSVLLLAGSMLLFSRKRFGRVMVTFGALGFMLGRYVSNLLPNFYFYEPYPRPEYYTAGIALSALTLVCVLSAPTARWLRRR